MQLSDGTLLQVLLRGRNVMALRQILDDLGACPAARKYACLRERKAPFEVWHGAGISALLAQAVRILEIDLVVRPA